MLVHSQSEFVKAWPKSRMLPKFETLQGRERRLPRFATPQGRMRDIQSL